MDSQKLETEYLKYPFSYEKRVVDDRQWNEYLDKLNQMRNSQVQIPVINGVLAEDFRAIRESILYGGCVELDPFHEDHWNMLVKARYSYGKR